MGLTGGGGKMGAQKHHELSVKVNFSLLLRLQWNKGNESMQEVDRLNVNRNNDGYLEWW